jgi:hypothetical protein
VGKKKKRELERFSQERNLPVPRQRGKKKIGDF